MPLVSNSFRVGKVQAYLRNKVWYLCYHDQGKRFRPRVGSCPREARKLAAQVNGQLASHAPASLSFEPVSIADLRGRWLEHHEQVLRSSPQTVDRYRTATDHLLRFLERRPVRHASAFRAGHAEEFVKHLRGLSVSPNGHANTAKRPLMDKGLKYVLECCRALFNYAARRRHLSPYAENPFASLDLDRIPVEVCRPVVLFTPEQEAEFVRRCDAWQFPLFLTLLLTGLRPGELCHLLLPEDLDLGGAVLRVRNKPRLGWQVKTRNERDIPLHPVLVQALECHLAGRRHGPVFLRRRFLPERLPSFASCRKRLEEEAENRRAAGAQTTGLRRQAKRYARRLWLELGAVEEGRVRTEFMRVTGSMGLPGCTAPKALRHLFATALQAGRVDPLIRNELMGHVAAGARSPGHGLGMTAVYTHSRPEVRREQLLKAVEPRPAVLAARDRLGDGLQEILLRPENTAVAGDSSADRASRKVQEEPFPSSRTCYGRPS
jgi:integrase